MIAMYAVSQINFDFIVKHYKTSWCNPQLIKRLTVSYGIRLMVSLQESDNCALVNI